MAHAAVLARQEREAKDKQQEEERKRAAAAEMKRRIDAEKDAEHNATSAATGASRYLPSTPSRRPNVIQPYQDQYVHSTLHVSAHAYSCVPIRSNNLYAPPSNHLRPSPTPGISVVTATPNVSSNFVTTRSSDSTYLQATDNTPLTPSQQRKFQKQQVKKRASEVSDGGMDVEWTRASQDVLGRKLDGSSVMRGSKRAMEEDGVYGSDRTREKRARKFSDVSMGTVNEHMDEEAKEEEEDQVMDLGSVPLLSSMRGKKRDRAAAGSTIGDEDAAELEKVGKKKRKSKRRSEVSEPGTSARGKKRDHHTSDDELDEREVNVKRARGKKGKKLSDEGRMSLGTPSEDDLTASRDPRCRGRRFGEEWEINGQKYKVSMNGERLRQTLVKKERTKYLMVGFAIFLLWFAGI